MAGQHSLGVTACQPETCRESITVSVMKRSATGTANGRCDEPRRRGSIDMKDAYATDAKIGENDLVTLEDDLHFFPQYKAVYLYRLSLPTNALAALQKISGTLDEARMIRLNAEAERTKNYARAAALYFGGASDT